VLEAGEEADDVTGLFMAPAKDEFVTSVKGANTHCGEAPPRGTGLFAQALSRREPSCEESDARLLVDK
jgi:hypothetical protein